jgi:SMP-30/Gluconolactonase/LRE-like region
MPASVRSDVAFDGHAVLGEGPVWDAGQQRLVWLDILPGLVHRFDPAAGSDDVFGVGKPVGSAGSVYRLAADLVVTKLFDGVTISNGLACTPDGATLYYIDSPTQAVDAFDYDAETGRLGNRRHLVDIPAAAGLPDGMTLDTDGCLWVALYGGSAVHRYTPGRPARRRAVLPGHQHHLPGLRRPGPRHALCDQCARRLGRAAARRSAARWRAFRRRRRCPGAARTEVRWLMPIGRSTLPLTAPTSWGPVAVDLVEVTVAVGASAAT